jgi:hypothetical protein
LLKNVLIDSKNFMFTEFNNFTDSLICVWMSDCAVFWFSLIFLDQLNLTLQNPVNEISFIALLVDYLIELIEIFVEEVRHELGNIEG